MQRKLTLFGAIALCIALAGGYVWSHCEIPCGIYDDEARIEMLREHATTIEKSMNEVAKLKNADERNDNQIVRWIMNKEDHANQAQEIVTQYFMTQRIKPADEGEARQKYVREITQLHQMLVALMQCKQTMDTAHVKDFRALVDAFEKSYMGKDEHDHAHH